MKLRIAEIAPLWERLPPEKYGGTERIVSSLTEHLAALGHNVTLYACGNSKTTAKLKSIYPRPLFRDNIPWTNIMYPLLHITEAFDNHENYDVIHMHLNKSSDYLALPLAESIKDKVIFTLHFPYPVSQNRMDRHKVLQKYRHLQYISISNSQRQGGENLNWIDTIYNGIEITPYSFHENPQNYFVWIGKFNPDKGVREAIQAAKKAKVQLILAGKIDSLEDEDYKYFKKDVEPFIDGKQIKFVGEVNDKQKNDLFGNALGFLNPIQWNEPFGMVMTESLATGTPVISFINGAAPEIIQSKINGFLVKSVDEMVKKIKVIYQINRENCRKSVLEKFTAEQMAKGYEKIMQSLHH